MERITVALAVATALLAAAGCRDLGEGPGTTRQPVPAGTYSYTAFDSSNAVVVRGWFTLAYTDSVSVVGEWHFQAVGNPRNIGPQVGADSLAGRLHGGTLSVNLQPHYMDNNVLLDGTLLGTGYAGTWSWISFIGLTSQGTFSATTGQYGQQGTITPPGHGANRR